MDKNGYFFYVSATAKKKKISLMQSKPPRVAFTEEEKPARRGRYGVAERVAPYTYADTGSVAPESTRVASYARSMSQRSSPPAPRARLNSQLECYQPRYHAIRDTDTLRKVHVQQDYTDHYVRGRTQQVKKHLIRTEVLNTKSHQNRDVNQYASSAASNSR